MVPRYKIYIKSMKYAVQRLKYYFTIINLVIYGLHKCIAVVIYYLFDYLAVVL